MSVSKIGMGLSPYVEQLKKDILHDALYYNIRERDARQIKKHLEKQKQIEQFSLINKRVSEQLNQEREKVMAKKNTIRNILANEYDRKIQEKRYIKEEQTRQNRSYAQAAIQNQDSYHLRRSRQIARMLRAQKTFQTYNPEVMPQKPSIRDRLATEVKNISNNKMEQWQPQQYGKQKLHSEVEDVRTPKAYKDYLLTQIQKKKNQKQFQVQQRLELQKSLSEQNYDILERQKQEQRQLKQKYKQMYKKELDEQIAEKKNFKNRY